MSLKGDFNVAVKRRLVLDGCVVRLEFEAATPYEAMALFDKIHYVIVEERKYINLSFNGFNDVVEK